MIGIVLSLVLLVAVVGAVPAAIWWTAQHGPLASVTVEGPDVVVRPSGWAAFWSLRRSVRFPVSSVRAVRVGVPRREAPRGFRSPGTALPGVMVAGTMRTFSARRFWLVGRAPAVTVVELDRSPTCPFDALVLELPEADVARLQALVTR